MRRLREGRHFCHSRKHLRRTHNAGQTFGINVSLVNDRGFFIFQTSRLPETLLNWLPLTTSRIKMAPLLTAGSKRETCLLRTLETDLAWDDAAEASHLGGFLKQVNTTSFELVHHRVDQAVQFFPVLWMRVRNPEGQASHPPFFLSSGDYGAPALGLAS